MSARRRARTALAEPGIGDNALGVTPRTGQRQAERAGHRTLGPAGVWRAVLARVAQHDHDGARPGFRCAKDRGRGNQHAR